jgi:hypothetical protein
MSTPHAAASLRERRAARADQAFERVLPYLVAGARNALLELEELETALHDRGVAGELELELRARVALGEGYGYSQYANGAGRWSDDRVRAELREELLDAIVYAALELMPAGEPIA